MLGHCAPKQKLITKREKSERSDPSPNPVIFLN